MSSFSAERRGLSLPALVLTLLALAGCPSSHPCDNAEQCNGRDDDCDGRADEDFMDERGRYVVNEACGSCDVNCLDVFPGATETQCNSAEPAPICQLNECAKGSHSFEGTACVPDQPVLCLPCVDDDDCNGRAPDSRCVTVAGESRCGTACTNDSDCDSPFKCDRALKQCRPEPALCGCMGTGESFEVACLARGTAAGLFCAGISKCTPNGLGECEIASVESCDGQDDDCDGQIDEDFVDARGRYVGPLHCGGCGRPCTSPGPHYDATCSVVGTLVSCDIACEPTFVDVDGIRANGCECQRFDGSSAPVVVGGDLNCDGTVDDSNVFVHVTAGGVDDGPGTLVQPLRSLDAAIARAATENKSVLVAQGSYAPFAVRAGVSVFGGYRADFRARDPELYPVVIEGSVDGAPVLTCSGVRGAAVIEGITLRGSDATRVGGGSTTAVFDGCGPEVKLSQVTVLAGRGADGARGDDASARLPTGSLAELNGNDGFAGRQGDAAFQACVNLPGGSGGQKSCANRDVSGGTGGIASCAETGCVNGQSCANAGCTDFTVEGVCDYASVLALAVPNPPAAPGRGVAPGLPGAQSYNAPTNRGVCNFCDDNPTLNRLGQDGSDGAAGLPGTAGPGCFDPALTFDADGRGSATLGADAPSGTDGSGGGGGSAGSGFDVIGGTFRANNEACDDSSGGSGGGGGSGGCGSPGGGGGGGGGASIGLLVRVTSEGNGPLFDRVRLVTASGGRGGDGGIGAAGGRGGVGGTGGGSRFFCARGGGRGGDGGDGGAGGGGGGGCGGASHALFVQGAGDAYRSDAAGTLTIERAGVSGQGGRGGFSPGQTGTPGAAGANDPIR
jgi:hypothetical protein